MEENHIPYQIQLQRAYLKTETAEDAVFLKPY